MDGIKKCGRSFWSTVKFQSMTRGMREIGRIVEGDQRTVNSGSY